MFYKRPRLLFCQRRELLLQTNGGHWDREQAEYACRHGGGSASSKRHEKQQGKRN
jgi:hypothetical protein